MRKLLTLSVAIILAVAAGCGGDSPTSSEPKEEEAETLSFVAIQGDWEGEAQQPAGGPTFWVELSITRDSAGVHEVVGSLAEFDSEAGELLCRSDMFARIPDPPTYTFTLQYTFRTDGCGDVVGGVLRSQHDEAAGTLTYEWKAPSSSNFVEWATLTPAS